MPRVFVAADIHRKGELENIQKNLISSLKLEHVHLKLVKPENFHFTLVFFGEINDSLLDKIVTKISEIEFQSFGISYDPIGAFPDIKRAKVIWIGLDEETKHTFSQMYDIVISKLKELDLKLENEMEKEIIPHITLFRARKVPLCLNLQQVQSDNKIDDVIDAISVKKSLITPHGPTYENIISVKGK